ncbi:hypothetical protein ES703_44405 [subsurface metagenome]
MGLRHKAIVDTLEVGTHDQWNDDHLADFSDEITLYEDFITPVITTKWDLTQGGAGVAAVITFQDHHSFAKLDSGVNAGDWSAMRYEFNGAAGNITYVNDAPVMNMAVWMDAYAATGKTAEFGLQDNAVAPFTANQDGAYFRINANKLYAVTGDGAAETATDITPVLGISEYAAYRIELGAATCSFYVEDMETPAATHTTNLPDSDLTLSFAARNDAGTKAEMYVDGVALTRNRYKG